MQRARDRRGRKCQDIHQGPHLFELLLVLHTESLFFINNDQPQILKIHVFLQQAMRSDDDIQFPEAQFCQGFFGLGGTLKTVQHVDADREIGQTLREGRIVLLGENGCRRQKSRLSAVHDCAERGTQGDFRFAEARVPADQPVHRFDIIHVFMDIFNGPGLIGGFFERKGRTEFLVDAVRGSKRFSFHRLSCRVYGRQFLGYVTHGFFNPFLDGVP